MTTTAEKIAIMQAYEDGEDVECCVEPSRVDRLIKCKRRVTPGTAIRLARFFGGSPKFWLNLQTNYDLDRAKGEGE